MNLDNYSLKYKGKKVLVTGAGGFIGRHLVENLLDADARVTAFIWHEAKDNNLLVKDISKEKLEAVDFRYGELKEFAGLAALFEGIDIVFHLAAINSVPYSLSHPREVLETNIQGTMNVMLAVRQCGTPRIVSISSAGVYGQPGRLPVDETFPVIPGSPYAASKLAGEEIALSFYHAFSSPVVIIRPFNVFGPGQSMNAVIPNIIVQALGGDQVKMGNMRATRDFNYVSDTVAGFMLAGVTDKVEGEIFNIASGMEHSIQEIIETIENILGMSMQVVTEDSRLRPGASDADRLVASITKAATRLNYQPMVSFREGLEKTIAYYEKKGDKHS